MHFLVFPFNLNWVLHLTRGLRDSEPEHHTRGNSRGIQRISFAVEQYVLELKGANCKMVGYVDVQTPADAHCKAVGVPQMKSSEEDLSERGHTACARRESRAHHKRVDVYAAALGRLAVIQSIVAYNPEPGIDIPSRGETSSMQVHAAVATSPEIAVVHGKLCLWRVLAAHRTCKNRQPNKQQ